MWVGQNASGYFISEPGRKERIILTTSSVSKLKPINPHKLRYRYLYRCDVMGDPSVHPGGQKVRQIDRSISFSCPRIPRTSLYLHVADMYADGPK